MSTIRVEIVSAERKIFEGEATMVMASAELGDLGIAPGHTPLITRIRPGEITVRTAENEEDLQIYVSGGILEVQPKIVSVLADTALRIDELDEASAQKAMDEARANLAANTGEVNYAEIQAQLAEAAAQLQLIKKIRGK